MHKEIGRIIKRKTSGYLRISVTLFFIAIAFIGIFAELFLSQYYQINSDFLKNRNTHVIEVGSKENDGMISGLCFSDVEEIQELLTQSKYNDANAYAELMLSFGVEGTDLGDSVFIYCLTDDSALLKDEYVQDNVLYGTTVDADNTVLKIPVVNIENGGASSDKCINCPVKIDKSSKLSETLSLNDTVIGKTYVSYNTYRKIIESCYSIKWNDFIAKVNAGENLESEIVSRIFVHSDKTDDIEDIAKLLNKNKYETNYTFKAFDNFSQSMKVTQAVVLCMLLMVLGITSINSYLSFKSYIQLQRKDMGILKHYGYDNSDIYRIYSFIVNSIFTKIVLAVILVTMIAGVMVLKSENLISGAIIGCLIVIIPSLALNLTVHCRLIRKCADEDILILLKRSKEFE